uniref:YeiH family protein n=1 Tax=Nosocomiicoccus ampullae TaxID=489910 RepID=UPI00082CA34A|nr:putative sulfate exporter family transporter [Nosocomiicoccus ampullae]
MKNKKLFTYGILFTILIASISYILAQLPLLSSIGALAIAIIISMIYRNTLGYPELLSDGITFVSKKLLRVAIILYGLKLNLYTIATDGLWLLVGGVFVILFSVFPLMFINKLLKGNEDIALLLGFGTGICGAAAIGAVSSIIKSDEEDTAISIGLISLVGTFFALIYTFLYPVVSMTDTVYGMWAGISLHEIAQVVLAGGVSDDSLAYALLAKLSRVFLLVPVSFALMYIWSKRNNSTNDRQKVNFPYFLIGFLLLAVVNTFIDIPSNVSSIVDEIAKFFMIMAMVGLGLNVSFKTLFNKAKAPMVSLLVTSSLLSIITYFVLILF